MHVLDANELFGITSYTYDRIMEIWGKYWPDAFALYFKLMKQARIQQTNQTYTLNKFLENYFWWGHERLTKAKKILKWLWLVDDVILRDEKGIITGHYVRVNYLIDENKIRNQGITYNLSTSLETQDMDTPTSGWMATNALSTKNINALNTKKENIYPLENNDLPLNSLAVSKERKVALKERKLAMAREEYNFVWEFLDRNNPITAYCYSKYPDYEGSQMEAVDKLMKQGYPLEVIKMALMYIKQDKFWSKNILSVKKLLEKNKDGIPYIVTIIQQMKDYKPVVAEL